MKKYLFFAALMCCMVSVGAQQPRNVQEAFKEMQNKIRKVERWNHYVNTFSEKLDSLCIDFEKYLFEYDERFNCVKIDNYWLDDEWTLDYTQEYTYDEQDRVVVFVERYDNYAMMSEYSYNDQGWLSEELMYEFDGDVWIQSGKNVFEYDADGHLVLSESFGYDGEWQPASKMVLEYEGGRLLNDVFYYYGENDWLPMMKNDYTYNAEGLCLQRLQYSWANEWMEDNKVEYEFDASGNRISQTISSHYLLDDWVEAYKIEYTYDTNGNCLTTKDYYSDEAKGWVLDFTTTYTYDLSVSADATAGIWMVWDDDLPLYNKVLDWQILISDDGYSAIFYYSNCLAVSDLFKDGMNVWPNPASTFVHIDGFDVAEARVYNAVGQCVKTMKGSNEINVAELVEGVYLLRVTDTEGKFHATKVVLK